MYEGEGECEGISARGISRKSNYARSFCGRFIFFFRRRRERVLMSGKLAFAGVSMIEMTSVCCLIDLHDCFFIFKHNRMNLQSVNVYKTVSLLF